MDTLILENKWRMLQQQYSNDYSSIRISKECIPDLFLSYDREKNRCLIFSLPKSDSVDFIAETREYISIRYFDESKHIVIRLQEAKFNDVFNSFILSVYHRIKSIGHTETAVSEFLKVYHEWSEFFAESSSQLLSYNEVLGIVGELFFLKCLVTESPAHEINELLNSWTGPYDQGHDFTFSSLDIEVKTKPVSKSHVQISSEFQLEAVFGKELTLVVVSVLTNGEGTKTLAGFITEIKDMIIERLGQMTIFLKAIGRKGLTLMNLSAYDHYRFTIKKVVSYNCNAEGFPKLVASGIPKEIRQLHYSLLTEVLTDYITEQNDY